MSLRKFRIVGLSVLLLIVVFRSQSLLAQQSYIYAMNLGVARGSAFVPYVYKIDKATGVVVDTYTNLQGSNGRGVAVVGNTMYYTTAWATPNVVYAYDLKYHYDLGPAFTVSPASALASLAYYNGSLWIEGYCLGSGCTVKDVYQYSLSGNLQNHWTVQNCAGSCDGMEVARIPGKFGGQPVLISNRADGKNPYDVYDLKGKLIQSSLISDVNMTTGITWDGLNFYVANTVTASLSIWDASGNPAGKLTLSGWPAGYAPHIEDVSVDYSAQPVINQCLAAVAPAATVNGKNVRAFSPLSSWQGSNTDIVTVQVEPTVGTRQWITTTKPVNSCASNSVTLQTVCTGNDNTVYVISGTAITNTLQSGGTGTITFSGGSCTNCGVAMDVQSNSAWIALSDNGRGAFQRLDLNTLTFGPIIDSQAPGGSLFPSVSEGILVDPMRGAILNPVELGGYELFYSPTPFVNFFEHSVNAQLDSAAEDCSTSIALASNENSPPVTVFMADLTQLKLNFFFPQTWDAPSQNFQLTQADLPNTEYGGIAVAQGTHIGIMTTEFSSEALVAFRLPATSGSGVPAMQDWVTCSVGHNFSSSSDPHDLTAYMTPDGSYDAIAILTQSDRFARVDLTKMLDQTIVPRTPAVGGHLCKNGTLPASVVTLIPF
jgi:hypothetical protein